MSGKSPEEAQLEEELKEPWRVGRKLGRTLYREDEFMGLVESKETAALIVDLLNQHEVRSKNEP